MLTQPVPRLGLSVATALLTSRHSAWPPCFLGSPALTSPAFRDLPAEMHAHQALLCAHTEVMCFPSDLAFLLGGFQAPPAQKSWTLLPSDNDRHAACQAPSHYLSPLQPSCPAWGLIACFANRENSKDIVWVIMHVNSRAEESTYLSDHETSSCTSEPIRPPLPRKPELSPALHPPGLPTSSPVSFLRFQLTGLPLLNSSGSNLALRNLVANYRVSWMDLWLFHMYLSDSQETC